MLDLALVLSALSILISLTTITLTIRTELRARALDRAIAESDLAYRAELDHVAHLIAIGRDTMRH